MKKLTFLLFPAVFFFCFSKISVFASERMDFQNRIFEIGFDADFGLSNNYFAANDFLKEELTVELNKMSSDLNDDGLKFNFLLATSFFTRLNLKNGLSVALSTGLDSYGMGNVSKKLFDFLSNGNELNETLETDGSIDANMFFYVTNDVEFELFGFRVGISPSVFIPVLHAEAKNINAKFTNDSSGNIDMELSARIKFNSSTDLHPLFDDKIADFILKSLSNGWGFDLSSSMEHQITQTLAGRGYIHIPIVPGHTTNSAFANYTTTYHADDVIDLVSSGGELSNNADDVVYDEEKMWISRPFRTGGEICWKPFGKGVSFNAMLGFGVKYPWTNDAKAYLEYKAGIDARLFNILGVKMSTSYLKEVFIHQVGFMVNFRVIELNCGVSAQGANFSPSCRGSGFGAYAGVRFGW